MPHLKNKHLIHLNMSEKFSLKWNDYQSNWTKSLSELRNDTESADVTLISDDKVKFTAHKVLLSSCSETFKFILKECNQTKSILFLSGVTSVNLKFILDYMYCGQVNLIQEQLDSFLASAEKLEVHGLVGNGQGSTDSSKLEPDIDNDHRYIQEDHYDKPMEEGIINITSAPVDTIKRKNTKLVRSHSNDAARIDVASMSSEEIKMKIGELYEKTDGVWRCLVCDYITDNSSGIIRRHIESHLDGLSYTCTLCNKDFRSKNYLTWHKSSFHKYLQVQR